MIVKLCQDTPMLAVRIQKRGCDPQQLIDAGVDMCIYTATCCVPPRTRLIKKDCTWERIPIEPAIPTLSYPAFETDDDGRIVFFFDDKLWKLPSGRYIAQITANRIPVSNPIDIDLCNDISYVAEVSLIPTSPCGELPC